MTPDQAPEPTPTPTPDEKPEATPEPAPAEPVEEPAPEAPTAEETAPAEAPSEAPAEEPAPAAEEPVAEPAPEAPATEEPAPVVPMGGDAPASSAPLMNAEPAKKSKTGLIIGLLIAVIAVVAIVVVVFAVIIPNANKGNGGEKKEGGNSKEEKKEDTPAVVGTYEAYSTIDASGKESTETIAFMKAFGATMTLEFSKDGTGKMITKSDPSSISIDLGDDDGDDDDDEDDEDGSSITINGQDLEDAEPQEVAVDLTWDKDGSISMKNPETGEDQTGTWKLSDDNNYVTITFDNEGMKFKRI